MSLRDELAFWGINLPEDMSVDALVQRLRDKPCQNAIALVGLASVLFYLAERDYNNRVAELWDATEYCSSSLSVGYTDIYPQTPVGKIIGTLLMIIGPAVASQTLDGTAESAQDDTQGQILTTLQQILSRLSQSPAAQPE